MQGSFNGFLWIVNIWSWDVLLLDFFVCNLFELIHLQTSGAEYAGFLCNPNTVHLQCHACGGMMPSRNDIGVPQHCKYLPTLLLFCWFCCLDGYLWVCFPYYNFYLEIRQGICLYLGYYLLLCKYWPTVWVVWIEVLDFKLWFKL